MHNSCIAPNSIYAMASILLQLFLSLTLISNHWGIYLHDNIWILDLNIVNTLITYCLPSVKILCYSDLGHLTYFSNLPT